MSLKLLKIFFCALIALSVCLTSFKVEPVRAACNPSLSANGTANFALNVPNPNTYRFWAHIFAPSQGIDAVSVQLDSNCPVTVGNGTAISPGKFSWVDYSDGVLSNKINFKINAGSHTVSIVGVDAGVAVDKVMFLADSTCIPVNDGSNCIMPANKVGPSGATPGSSGTQQATTVIPTPSQQTSATPTPKQNSTAKPALPSQAGKLGSPMNIVAIVSVVILLTLGVGLGIWRFRIFDLAKRIFGNKNPMTAPKDVALASNQFSAHQMHRRRNIIISVSSGLIVLAGAVMVRLIMASSPGVAYLLADANLANQAVVVKDTSAIGGRMVRFGGSGQETQSNTSTPAQSAPAPVPPVATVGSTCALPEYPTPSCVGLPAGTSFVKTVNGDYIAKANGEQISGWHITGSLVIAAANVSVRNSQIDGTVDNEVGTTHYVPFTISDTTIGPVSGCIGSPGLGEDGYTAIRIYVRGHDDGFRMSGNNISISDSYAKLCYLPPAAAPPDGSHSDGIQAYCPDRTCTGLTFNHNTVDAQGVPATFMLNLVDPQLSVVTANDNLLIGGAYTVVPYWHSGANWIFQNNRIVYKAWTYGAVDAGGTCAHQNWAGNTLVTIDGNYAITSTVGAQLCIN